MNQLFEMIPCSSGELPEKSGRYWVYKGHYRGFFHYYNKDSGIWADNNGNNYSHSQAEYWLKPIPAPTRVTLQEAKDEVAKRHGYEDWRSWRIGIIDGVITVNDVDMLETYMDEVYELLASGSSPVPTKEGLNQNLFEAIQRVTGFTPLVGDMDEIIRAVDADRGSPVQGEAMSWEWALMLTAQKHGYSDWMDQVARQLNPDFEFKLIGEAATLFMETNREAYGRDRWKAGAEAMKESIIEYYAHHFPIQSDQVETAPLPDFQP